MEEIGFYFSSDKKTLLSFDPENCPAVVEVPSGVEKIADGVFSGTMASSIIIPDSVTEIGVELFAGAENLKEVTLSRNIRKLGHGTFRCCTSLKKVVLPDELSEFPDSIFEGCESLEEIPFRYGIKEIPMNAFTGCTSLKSVVIPNTVETIKYGALSECTNLHTVVLPGGIRKIEDGAFSGCPALRHIRFAEENPVFFTDEDTGCLYERRDDGKLILIKAPVNLTEIFFSKDVVQTHSEAFEGCESIKQIFLDCEPVDHPLFVALKTEIISAKLIGPEEAAALKAAEPVPQSDFTPDELNLDGEDFNEDEGVFPDEESSEEDSNTDAVLEAGGLQEGAGTAEDAGITENISGTESNADAATDANGDTVIDDEEETFVEIEDPYAAWLEQEKSDGSAPEQSGNDDIIENVTITPEELDEAVQRGIQEEEEAKKALKAPEGFFPEPKKEPEEEAPVEDAEPVFINGMESMSKQFVIFKEEDLYGQKQDKTLEDIETLIVIEERVSPEGFSEEILDFAKSIAKSNNLRKVYVFGGMSLDNDEFLFGFGKFALYRNIIYAVQADSEASLPKEIQSLAEIAELRSPAEKIPPLKDAQALALEKPFKLFVQDNMIEEMTTETVTVEEDLSIDDSIFEKESDALTEEADTEEAAEVKGVGLLVLAQRYLDEQGL